MMSDTIKAFGVRTTPDCGCENCTKRKIHEADAKRMREMGIALEVLGEWTCLKQPVEKKDA